MSKNKNKSVVAKHDAPEVQNDSATQPVEAEQNVEVTVEHPLDRKVKYIPSNVSIDADGNVTLKRGRPADPNSDRYKREMEKKAKIAAGVELKRGRPIDPTSERHQREMEKQAKLDAGIKLQQGRPVDKGSVRQQQLAARAEKLATIKALIAEQESADEA